MMRCIIILLDLFLVVSTHAWILTTNFNEITPGRTQDVNLVCKQDSAPDDNINTVSRLIITKMDPFRSKIKVAIVQAQDKYVSAFEDNFIITGVIDNSGDSFLNVTWPNATETTAGAYRCEISGFDESDNFVSLYTKPVLIKEKILTMQDVNSLIQSATSVYQKKQKELETELASLKIYIKNEMESARKESKDDDEKIQTNVSNLKIELLSNYTTKTEFTVQVSKLKNFTANEIAADNNRDELKHNELLESIQNTTTKGLEMSRNLTINISEIKHGFNSKFERQERIYTDFSRQINSSLENLQKDLDSVDSKYKMITDDITANMSQKNLDISSPCSTPESSTGTSTPPTTAINDIQWPTGRYYGLVRSRSGCPDASHFNVYTNKVQWIGEVSFQNFFFLLSGGIKTPLKQCLRSGAPSSQKWPKGTYCIGLFNEGKYCPPSFNIGWMSYHINPKDDSNTFGTYGNHVCCRSDGPASSPIELPTKKEFYLYRYKGTCQEVKDMKVTEDSIVIDIGQNFSYFYTHLTGVEPDTNDRGNPITLCHYQR